MKKKIKAKLKDITSQVEPVPNTKAIDDATTYSFQYNLKIVGVPQKNERETAEETTMLCLKIFSKIGLNVSENDIDIAHRVPARSQYGRRRHSSVEDYNSVEVKTAG